MYESKKLFKAVVIDDEQIRNKTYNDVLSNKYEVKIINEVEDINRREIMQFDLMVIDICLSKNVDTLTAFKVMRDYNLTLPTVIVSSEWVRENGEPNEFILQVPNHKNVIKVISWNDFNKEENNCKIAEDIFYNFCKYKNLAVENKKDRCVLLHISDPQFGGNASGLSCNDKNRIVSFLEKNKIEPDLLFITGDIADKGKKSEFEQAKVWIEDLVKKLWCTNEDLSNKQRDRIIIVPGNHDYDLSINASEFYEFKFASSSIDTFERKSDIEKYFNQEIGFYNFIDFAYKLTGNIGWYKYLEKAFSVNRKFLNFGINIYLLNSVYEISNRNCENRFDKFYCDLSGLPESKLNISEESKETLCNILVMHNPPSDFRKGTDNGEKSWNRMQTLIEDNKINICLYGHTHDFSDAFYLRDNGGKYCKRMLCIPAPSVRLGASSRTEDAYRGFNVIELYKENGMITKVKPRYFQMKKASISEVQEDDEIYNIIHGE